MEIALPRGGSASEIGSQVVYTEPGSNYPADGGGVLPTDRLAEDRFSINQFVARLSRVPAFDPRFTVSRTIAGQVPRGDFLAGSNGDFV